MMPCSSSVFSRSARTLEEMPSSDLVSSSRKCRRLPNIMSRITSRLHLSPTASGEVADFMNAAPKYVFSRTLKTSGWNNTRMFASDLPGTVARLKRESPKDIFLFGSAGLASHLIPHGLIDEFRIAVNPVILGGGTPLFKQGERLELKLLDARALSTGVVILRYVPAT